MQEVLPITDNCKVNMPKLFLLPEENLLAIYGYLNKMVAAKAGEEINIITGLQGLQEVVLQDQPEAPEDALTCPPQSEGVPVMYESEPEAPAPVNPRPKIHNINESMNEDGM
jgi:hypothetical protein